MASLALVGLLSWWALFSMTVAVLAMLTMLVVAMVRSSAAGVTLVALVVRLTPIATMVCLRRFLRFTYPT